MNFKRWLGLILIFLGVLFVLNNAGVVEIGFGELIATYWPLILIFVGLYNLFTNPAGRVGGIIVLLMGGLFLARNLDQLEIFDYVSFWALLLIIFGLWLFLRGGQGSTKVDVETLNLINIFSGSSSKIVSDNFKGGSSISVFGGADIDLREADIDGKEARLDVFAMFGGSDIHVPRNWKVIVKGIPLFGGWDDNTSFSGEESKEESPTLIINCMAIFGGIDVNN